MSTRFRSLDVFRGATVALMILVNNPGSWTAIYPPLAHAKWHGCTPTDLVFPFFLFAVGNSIALVMPAFQNRPAIDFWLRILRRTLLIFLIGLILNASPFVRWDNDNHLVLKSWESLRFLGVLQRIALCFGATAIIVWLCERIGNSHGVLWCVAVLLVGYWAACLIYGAPGDPYSMQGFFGTPIDKAVLGESHMYHGEGIAFEPEGIVSTLPSIAQVLLGWWAGKMILGLKLGTELIARLFLWATMFLLITYFWQLQLPLNKKIWTSTFVLHATGLAMMGLALFIQLIEIQQPHTESPLRVRLERTLMLWVPFFEVFGKNPLFVFVMSGLIPRCLGLVRWQDGVNANGAPNWNSPLPWIYKNLFAGISNDPRFGSFLYAIAMVAAYWLLAMWLDKRRIYIRV